MKNDRVQIITNYELPFLDIKMSCSPEGDLNLGVFRKKGRKLNYVGMGRTHKPGNLRAIPSGVINCLGKLTSHKTSFHSERVDNVYPDHSNALCRAGLAPPIFPTMGELWKGQHEKTDIDN